jgi:hypothetical protein
LSSGFNDSAMNLIILGIIFLWGSALIIIGIKDPEKFINKRQVILFSAILGKDDTIKIFRFIGKMALYVSIGMFLLAFYTYFFE